MKSVVPSYPHHGISLQAIDLCHYWRSYGATSHIRRLEYPHSIEDALYEKKRACNAAEIDLVRE